MTQQAPLDLSDSMEMSDVEEQEAFGEKSK